MTPSCWSTAIAISIFPISPTTSTPWWRAPGTAGIGRMVTISTRVRRHAELLAHRRALCRRVLLGRHPSASRRTKSSTSTRPTSWSASRHPKVVAIGEAGLDYHYDNSPREAQEQGFRTHIAAARETGLPLVIHAREADDDMARILEEEMGQGRLPGRAALLHRRPRARPARGIALGLYVSFTGILTFKNSRRPARHRGRAAGRPHPGRDRRALSRARPLPRQAQRAGLCGRDRQGAGRGPRRLVRRRSRAQTTDNFFRLFAKVPRRRARPRGAHDAALHHSGLRLIRRRAAAGARLGRLRSRTIRRTAGGGPRCWSSAAAPTASPACWSTPRPTCASSFSMPTSIGSMACSFTPRARRPHPWHRRSARRCSSTRAGGSTSISTSRPRAMMRPRFGYCFETPPGSEYPPIVTEHRMQAGQPVTIEGAGRPDHGAARPAAARRHYFARLPLRRASPIPATSAACPTTSVAALAGPRRLDRRRAALRAASEPFQRRRGARLDRAPQATARDPTNLHADLDYETCARSCRRTSSRPLMASPSICLTRAASSGPSASPCKSF